MKRMYVIWIAAMVIGVIGIGIKPCAAENVFAPQMKQFIMKHAAISYKKAIMTTVASALTKPFKGNSN